MEINWCEVILNNNLFENIISKILKYHILILHHWPLNVLLNIHNISTLLHLIVKIFIVMVNGGYINNMIILIKLNILN